MIYNGFLGNKIPFIMNLEKGPGEKRVQDIDESGVYDTFNCIAVDVKVTEGSELTPEAQEEILSEEY